MHARVSQEQSFPTPPIHHSSSPFHLTSPHAKLIAKNTTFIDVNYKSCIIMYKKYHSSGCHTIYFYMKVFLLLFSKWHQVKAVLG